MEFKRELISKDIILLKIFDGPTKTHSVNQLVSSTTKNLPYSISHVQYITMLDHKLYHYIEIIIQ